MKGLGIKSYIIHLKKPQKIYVFCWFTFHGHPRSKVIALNESPCMISYMSVIQTKSLPLRVIKILAKNILYDLEILMVKMVNEYVCMVIFE